MDEHKVMHLSKTFFDIVKTHYQKGPTHRDRVLEVLNALAVVTAHVVGGADGRAQEFFNDAFEQQIDELIKRGAAE